MSERCALVLDSDPQYSALVERALGSSGLKVHVLEAAGDGSLDRIVDMRPELVFVAVDLPERAGFAVCNKTKSLVKGARVVLATSTIPWREMELHQKLKVHADLYLDKRRITADELSRQLAGLLRPPDPGREPEAPPAPPPVSAPASPPSAVVAGHPDVDALLAELQSMSSPGAEREAVAAPADDAPRDPEIVRLERELDEVRRYARQSPFSKDFITLRDRLAEKEGEAGRLREQLADYGRRLAALQGHAREVLVPLVAALKEKSSAEAELAGRLGVAEASLWKELEERRELEERQARELREATDRLAQEQARSREVETRAAQAEARLAEATTRADEAEEATLAAAEIARTDAERSLEEERRTHRDFMERKERDYQAALYKAIEELETLKLRMQSQDQRAAEIAEANLRQEQAAHVEALQAAEHQHLAALVGLETRLNLEKNQELEELRAEAQRKLEAARAETAQAVAATQKGRGDEIASIDAAHRQALARQETEHREQLAALRSRLQQHHEESQRLYESRLAEAQALYTEGRRRADEEHALSLRAVETRFQAEKGHALESQKEEWEAKLAKLRREHERALEAAANEHDDNLGAQQLVHREEVSRLEAEHQVAQRRVADEREAMRVALQQQEQETRRRYEARLAEVLAAQAEARKQVTENQLAALKAIEDSQAEKDRGIAAVRADAERGVARLREDHAAAVAALRQDQAREQQAREAAAREAGVREKEHRDALARAAEQLELLRTEATRRDEELKRLQAQVADGRRHADEQQKKADEQQKKALERQSVEHQAALRRAAEERAALQGALGEAQSASQAAVAKQRDAERREQELRARLVEAHAAAEAEAQKAAEQERATVAQLESHEKARAKREDEYRNLIKRAAEESTASKKRVVELEARAAELQNEARRRAEGEQRSLAAVEMRLHSEKEQALAAMHKAHTEALADKDTEFRAALKSAADEYGSLKKSSHQRELEIQRRYEEALTEARALVEKAQRAAAAAEARIGPTVDKTLEERGNALRAEWEKKLDRIRVEQADAVTSLHKKHEKEVGQLTEEVNAARSAAQQQEQDVRQRYEAKLAEVQASHLEGRKQASQDQAAALKALEVAQAEKVQALAIATERGQKLAADTRRHQNEVAALRATYKDLVSAEGEARAALQKAGEEITALRASLAQEKEAGKQKQEAEGAQAGALAALRQHHADELAKKESEMSLLRRAVEELAGLRAATEQVRQRYPDVFKEVFDKKAPKAAAEGPARKKPG